MTTQIDWTTTSVAPQEPATSWTRLDAELRMLCRGLRYPTGWLPEGVTTFVRLPGDAEYAQALATICRRLAVEFALTQTVVRDGDQWRVRFARTVAPEPAPSWRGETQPVVEEDVLRVAAVKAREALRRFAAAWGQRRKDVTKF